MKENKDKDKKNYIETNYSAIPVELFSNYLEYLISQVYKILPMSEQNDRTIIPHLMSLQVEIIGNIELMKEIKYDGNFQKVLANIEYLIHNNNLAIYQIRKIVLNTTNIIKKIKEKYF
jgi:hypothetical protein